MVQSVRHGEHGIHHLLNLPLLLIGGVSAHFLQPCEWIRPGVWKHRKKRIWPRNKSSEILMQTDLFHLQTFMYVYTSLALLRGSSTTLVQVNGREIIPPDYRRFIIDLVTFWTQVFFNPNIIPCGSPISGPSHCCLPHCHTHVTFTISYQYTSWCHPVSCHASQACIQSSPPRTLRTRHSYSCWTGSGSWSNSRMLQHDQKWQLKGANCDSIATSPASPHHSQMPSWWEWWWRPRPPSPAQCPPTEFYQFSIDIPLLRSWGGAYLKSLTHKCTFT